MKREFVRFVSAILVVFFAFSTDGLAAPGDLDPTFNGVGYVLPSIGAGGINGRAYSVVIQPDGKIIAAGAAFTSVPNGNDIVLARLNPDGTLDTSFDGDGIVYTEPGGDNHAYSVALQPDGKIVVAGLCQVGPGVEFLVIRYNSDGSLDTTFDTDGIVKTDIRGGSDTAFALAFQADGKIVVTGSSQPANLSSSDFTLVRYNANGSLDTSFDTDGKLFIDLSPGNYDNGNAAAVQLDGKIVVSAAFNGTSNAAVLRFNSDGSPDTSFDSDGINYVPSGTGGSATSTMAIQWDGKIVAGSGLFYDFVVARFRTDGSYDSAFDADGYVSTNISGSSIDNLKAIALQTDGKILAAGYSDNIEDYGVYSIARYNQDGSLDSSWGSGGKIFTVFPGGYDQINGAASAADGKIITVGIIDGKFAVARYLGTPNAAMAKISGQVVNAKGKGIPNARVVLTNTQAGTTKIITTNSFGYYSFYNLPTGANYTVTVSSKRNQFNQSSKSVQLFMNVLGLHFVGNR